MTETYVRLFILVGAGLATIYFGISGLLGYDRRFYIIPTRPRYRASVFQYGAIPLGIMIISWGVIEVLPLSDPTSCWSVTVLPGIVGFLLALFKPRFMMPEWYRWLNDNHADVLPLLEDDARSMGYDTWRKHTATQEGLEQWVAEVRQRHEKTNTI